MANDLGFPDSKEINGCIYGLAGLVLAGGALAVLFGWFLGRVI